MFSAIETHCDEKHQPSDIRIVLYGDNALKVFSDTLDEL